MLLTLWTAEVFDITQTVAHVSSLTIPPWNIDNNKKKHLNHVYLNRCYPMVHIAEENAWGKKQQTHHGRDCPLFRWPFIQKHE